MNEPTTPRPSLLARVGNWLKRWQEATGWLPTVVILAIGAWLVLGSLDALATTDTMALLVLLPIRVAYAFAALLLAYHGWRRWSYRLTGDELKDLWRRLMRGQLGAIVVFVVNAGFFLCLTLALLLFFSLRS